MDATLAPPRNQLDPLENHWNSLHFQCPALMRNSARQRHPGDQCEILRLLENHQTPLATVTFDVPEMPAAGLKIWGRYFRWFVCGLSSAQCIRKPFKTIGKHSISKHPRRNAEHSKELRHRAEEAGQRKLRRRIWCR